MSDDNKRMAEAKRKFDLHVLLLQEKQGLTKTKAMVEAYIAGMPGLERLLKPAVAEAPLLQGLEKAPK